MSTRAARRWGKPWRLAGTPRRSTLEVAVAPRGPIDQIVDDDAAQLMGSASAAISRPFLVECLVRVEARVAALPTSDADFLTSQRLGGSEFTLLDRCIGQFRHTQHHIGMIHEKLAKSGATAADWRGYREV